MMKAELNTTHEEIHPYWRSHNGHQRASSFIPIDIIYGEGHRLETRHDKEKKPLNKWLSMVYQLRLFFRQVLTGSYQAPPASSHAKVVDLSHPAS